MRRRAVVRPRAHGAPASGAPRPRRRRAPAPPGWPGRPPPRGRRARRGRRAPPRARAPRAQRARAREEVQDERAVERAEDAEQRLADAVGRRARGAPGGACRRRPPKRPATIRIGLTPGSAARSVAPCAARSASRQQHVLGRRQLGVGVERSRATARARSSSAPSSGRRATRKPAAARTGACRSAPPRRAARGRSRPGAKPSRCSAERLQARATPCGPKSRHTDACSPRPIRPRSWCSWRDAVALGVLDDHDRRVGHVDADLDHRGRHEHVGLARGEGAPSPAASRAGAAGRGAARRGSRRAPSSRRRSNSAVAARACSASDSSTSGQTTKAWRPGAQLLADALVGALALALAVERRASRSAGARAGSSRSVVTSRSP